MKILIDTGHPAHIHYFRNAVKLLEGKGDQVLFVVRDKESSVRLADRYGLSYISRGKGGSNVWQKLSMLPRIVKRLVSVAKDFKPDLFLSFASPYAAQAAFLTGKPHIAFDDTEHAVFSHLLYRSFTKEIHSPFYYLQKNKLHKRQKLFDSFMELAYLQTDYLEEVFGLGDKLGLAENESYVVLRFVSWDANHDIGQKGLSLKDKMRLVEMLSSHCRVFISSESKIDKQLEAYQLNIEPDYFHAVLKGASLYVGEGSTTACESCLLGTPAIYVNTLHVGNCAYLEEKGICTSTTDIEEIIKISSDILENSESSKYCRIQQEILNECIDTTQYIIDVLNKYR